MKKWGAIKVVDMCGEWNKIDYETNNMELKTQKSANIAQVRNKVNVINTVQCHEMSGGG